MIRSSELRVGSWVDYLGTYYRLNEEDLSDLFNPDIDMYGTDFEPIELTEKILLKCGFIKREFDYILPILDYGYVMKHLDWRGDWSLGIEYFDSNSEKDDGVVYSFNGLGLKYLHQLQNFYLSLVSKELEIEL